MTILTKYLIRAHTGPFFFALSVLTGMLFLNAVAQRMEDLAGKGLAWDVIAEFFILSVPHLIALTLPMSVLVAVLYAFSELTASNEFTAMTANGVRPQRMLLPLVGVGFILAGGMLFFNDRILPETNHRLKILSMDIGQKSPTFQLREQVVNEISTGDGQTRYFLQAVEIDNQESTLRDVVIHDLSDPARHRTIYADRGSMAFNPSGTDLYLTLFDGAIHELSSNQPDEFNRMAFGRQVIPLRGVSDELRRQQTDAYRSDREMSISQLRQAAREKKEELATVRQEARERSRQAVERALGLADAGAGALTLQDRARTSRISVASGQERPLERSTTQASGSGPRVATSGGERELRTDPVTRGVTMSLRTQATRSEILRMARNRYLVEVHKKFAIAFACVVFVFVGAPIAIRFPRGGVGMVITVSMAIFALYWMGLIGGEKMADTGRLDPFWAMWASNFLTLAVGLWLFARMGREVSTARGGGWDDLLHTVNRALKRPFRKSAADPGSATA